MLPYCCTLSFMENSFCIQSLYCRGVKKRDNTVFFTCGKEVECI